MVRRMTEYGKGVPLVGVENKRTCDLWTKE